MSKLLFIDQSLQDKYPGGGFKKPRRHLLKTFLKVLAGEAAGIAPGKTARHAPCKSGKDFKCLNQGNALGGVPASKFIK